MKRHLLVLLLVFQSDAMSADLVLRERTSNGLRQKSIKVAADSFNARYLERLARAELDRKPQAGFIQLILLGSEGGSPLPKPNHITYRYWRGLYDQLVKAPNEFAEMIAFGDNAVLRMRNRNGQVTRRVLEGTDPLFLRLEGESFEIMYVSIAEPRRFDPANRIDFYVRTASRLTSQVGLELLKRLEAVFFNLDVHLYVRNDGWFIYEPNFPFVNPFETVTSPISEEGLGATLTLQCNRASGIPACTLSL